MSPLKTGADYLADLRRAAREAGKSFSSYVSAIHSNPTMLARNLESATQPRPATIARIKALINGQPIPDLMRVMDIALPLPTYLLIIAEAKRTQTTANELAAQILCEGSAEFE
jgi:hypothetical protein